MAAVMMASMATPAVAQDGPVPRREVTVQAPDVATAAPARPVSRQLVPVELQVVIAKFQGDKRLSAIPYVLALNAVSGGNITTMERTQLTIGSEVPVPMTTFGPAGENKAAQPLRSFNYRNVGTVMSAAAVTADGGQYEIHLDIDESSLGTNASDGRGSATEMPVFKSFKARNRILLRPGQMRQFTAATDRISGETVRIEVTLTVVK
jgi:hypothetical protein